MAILTLLFAREVLGTYEMDRDVFVVGRASDCDIIIDNLNVSRHHAKVEKRDGLYYLEDLKSNNGTFLNNEAVTCETLTFGDEIGIGKHTLRFDSHSRLGRDGSAAGGPTHAAGLEADEGGTVVVNAEQMAAFQEKMSAARRAHLRISGVTGTKPVVQLDNGEAKIGRGMACDIRVPGLLVGRTHSIIGRRKTGYHIEQVGGLRALRINGQRRQSGTLADGDVIQVGPARITFHDTQTV